MAKEAENPPGKFPLLTDWAIENWRFLGELQSRGRINEAHNLKYNSVSRDEVSKILQSENSPGLSKLIESMPKADPPDSPKGTNGNSPSHGEPSQETPLVPSAAA